MADKNAPPLGLGPVFLLNLTENMEQLLLVDNSYVLHEMLASLLTRALVFPETSASAHSAVVVTEVSR